MTDKPKVKRWRQDLFRREIAPIFARHMIEAKGDPKKMAAIYETLAHFLGHAVAQGCKGDPKLIGVIVEGVTQHVVEVAAERQAIYQFLSSFDKRASA